MTCLSAQILIGAPKKKVWDVLADVGQMYLWNPCLMYSYCISGQERGAGTTIHCATHAIGTYFQERVVEWKEGEGYKIEVSECALHFKRSVFEFSLDAHAAGTVARVTHEYDLKYGPVGALMDRFWGKRVFGKAIEDLLAGLKYYVIAGVPVGDRVPEMTKQAL